MQNKDPFTSVDSILVKLEYISEDIKEIKSDVKAFNSDLADVREQQHKCNSYWGVFGKVLSIGSFSTALIYILFPFLKPPAH